MVGLLLVIAAMAILWVIVRPRDPMFRGKPESQWIEQLAYMDEKQVKQWRDFGTDGVELLVRGLEGANRPVDRFYRNTYRQTSRFLPGMVTGLLPAPRMDATRITRMKIVSLLSGLGKDAQGAVPAMARALKDENESVQAIAITFFTDTEGEDALLNQLQTLQKRALLPEFIRALGAGRDWGLRNNAALALKYYPEERAVVVPALTNALNDSMPNVRIVAAESLQRVAPGAAASEEVVRVVIDILRNPDDQIAYRAAELLAKMADQPALAVPALIEGVQGTNRLVASSAAGALGNFPAHAAVIVPILIQAYQDTNSIVSRRASGGALKKIAPEMAGSMGIK
jgi:hypothetical protein